jgi:hypothetical protein
MLEVNWLVILASGSVLFLPASLLYSSETKDYLAHSRSAHFRLEHLFLTWQHWFDFGRAYLATYFLIEYGCSFVGTESGMSYWYQDWLLIAAMLGVAVSLQTIQFREFFYFIAPIFFIWGMALALCDWLPVSFAIVFSSVVARLADHVELKLPLMAAILVVSGYLLSGLEPQLILGAALVVWPTLLALCSMRHLVCYSVGMPLRRSN